MTTMKKETVALFRFGVIFPLLDERLERGEQAKLLDELCGKEYKIPFSDRTSISRSTLLSWLRLYRKERSVEALMPKGRSDKGESRALDDETVEVLRNLRKANPDAPLTTIVNDAVAGGELDPSFSKDSMPSVYRMFRDWEKDKASPSVDMRRFEMESCNDCWMLDAMVGPKCRFPDVGGRERTGTAYCFALIDDKSRYIVHAEFYRDQRTESLLGCIWKAFNKCGLPRMIFTDNGSAMRDVRLKLGLADLEVDLKYAKPYKGSSKAKIERFWRTMRMQFLPSIENAGTLTLFELNGRLGRYIEAYNNRYHSGIGCSPAERYLEDVKAVRPAPMELPLLFRHRIERRVSKARTVQVENILFEVPIGYMDKKIELRYMTLDDVEAFFDGKSIGKLKRVNLNANAHAGRYGK